MNNEINEILVLACINNNLAQVKRLIKEGASPKIEERGGVFYGQVELEVAIDFLNESGKNIGFREGKPWYHCSMFVKRKDLEEIKQLLTENEMKAYRLKEEKMNNELNQQLIDACRYSNLEEVKKLILAGADVNFMNNEGHSAISWASYWDCPSIVQLLIFAGANVNAKEGGFRTPLIEASHKGLLRNVLLLINAGADVNAKDDEGQTAFSKAVYYNYRSLLKPLIEAGADVNVENRYGSGTALMKAIDWDCQETIKMLLNNGANINHQSSRNGETALMEAGRKGKTDFVELLIKEGADVNLKDNNGYTVLMFACLCGHKKVVELLLRAGANVNPQIIKYDCIRGRWVNIPTTALMFAKNKGHTDIVWVIRRHLLKKFVKNIFKYFKF